MFCILKNNNSTLYSLKLICDVVSLKLMEVLEDSSVDEYG